MGAAVLHHKCCKTAVAIIDDRSLKFDLETVGFRHALKTTVPDSIGFGVRLTDTGICFHNLVCLADAKLLTSNIC